MNSYEETVLNTLFDKYPGYLFEFEYYPAMMIVRVRSKGSGLENKKAITKNSNASFIVYEIERMINEMREKELKNVVSCWSNKNFIEMGSYLDIRPMSINKYSIVPNELIFQDEKTTIINWTDGTKTIVKCSDDDTFSPEAGVALCYMKKFITNNDAERFHRLLKGLISKSKFKKSKQEDKSSGLSNILAVGVSSTIGLYCKEENE